MQAELVASEEVPQDIPCEALLVGAFAAADGPTLGTVGRALDDAFEGNIAEYLRTVGFKAKVGELVTIPTMGKVPATAVTVVGLGPRDDVTSAEVRRAA